MTTTEAPERERAVLLVDGPLAGQAFTREDFGVRWHAADRIARNGGQRGPALDYRAAGPGDWHKVPAQPPLLKRNGREVPVTELYDVTCLVWAGDEATAQRWRDATSAAIHAAARAAGEHEHESDVVA